MFKVLIPAQYQYSGKASMQGNITQMGNGNVLSHGPSHLWVGYRQVSFTAVFTNSNDIDVTDNMTPFSGGNVEVRVSIIRFVPDSSPDSQLLAICYLYGT